MTDFTPSSTDTDGADMPAADGRGRRRRRPTPRPRAEPSPSAESDEVGVDQR